MSNRIVLESAPEVLDGLRSKIAQEKYWFAGTIVGVIAGSFLPGEPIKIFAVFAGGVFAILIFAELCFSIRHENRWHEARESAYRIQNGLPLPEHLSKGLSLEPDAPVVKVVHTTTREGGAHTTAHEYSIKELPTRDLIEWLFANADDNGGIPSEAATFAKFTASANLQLDTLVAEGILEKVGEHANAPRRIVDGVTVKEALERFGYAAKEGE